jgi:hypothetical protein
MSSPRKSPLRSELFEQASTLTRELPALVHTWRFAVGAVFALSEHYRLALEAPQSGRLEADYCEDTERLITAMRDGSLPSADWLRGFYYNAAIMRIDALYERLFRAVLDDESMGQNGPALYSALQKWHSALLPEPYEASPFKHVRDEANSLKHYVGGAAPALRERVTLLRAALEHWFAFVSDTEVRSLLARKYGQRKPVSGKR